MKVLTELKDGDDWRVFRGMVIIANKDRPPRFIKSDGTEVNFEKAVKATAGW